MKLPVMQTVRVVFIPIVRKAAARNNRSSLNARNARTLCHACGTPNGGETAMMASDNQDCLTNALRFGATRSLSANSAQNASQTNQFTDIAKR